MCSTVKPSYVKGCKLELLLEPQSLASEWYLWGKGGDGQFVQDG